VLRGIGGVAAVLVRIGDERVAQPEFHVWTLHDDQIGRLAWFRSLDEALNAAGLTSLQ
jgi:hypothetical protein